MSKRTLTALLAFVAVAVAIGTVVLARETAPALTREELLAYQDAIHPPLAEARRQAAVDDLRAGAVAQPSLTDARNQVAAIEAPEALGEVKRLFVRALDQYLSAAGLFARGQDDNGVATAKSADRTYEEASRILQDLRRRLGLDPTAEFPDPR